MRKIALLMMLLAMAASHRETQAKNSAPVIEIMPIEAAEITKTAEVTQSTEPVIRDLGEFKLTAYCSCSKCCGKWAENRPTDENGNEIVYGASGKVLKAGYSIAVDPTVIPYGTKVIINGQVYEAQDCGGAIKNKRIDVYFNDHNEALKFGVQYAQVYMEEVNELR